MHPLLLADTEWLENEDARRILLRMAALSQAGRSPSFVAEVAHDRGPDAETKDQLVELAQDEPFLLAVVQHLTACSALIESQREEMGDPGFEPGTSALSERRSNQLS
jgi:hypothetical protein